MKHRCVFLAVMFFGVVAFGGSARAIVVGQIDNFEDGTTQSWANGGAPGVPPVENIATGGPAGVDDNFMQVTAVGGSGAGRFLTVFNRDQWLGNYISLGITAIELDLRNLSKVDLNIRLGFKTDPGVGASGYLTTAFSLTAGSGWQHAIFLINPGSMTAVGGPADFNTFFSGGFSEMRIINEAGTGNLNGDIVAAQLGVDNIHAVPEPGAILLMAVGTFTFAAFRRRGRS
jgi:hypothetical protein